jgi:hypothetical protein
MGEKKEKSAKSKIEIQTRKPEKRGIFANLGSDRKKNDHPLREILNFPTELDSQTDQLQISKDDSFGYPNNSISEIQNTIEGYPNNNPLDIQSDILSYPNSANVDSQTRPDLDIQTEISGYPKLPVSDSTQDSFGNPKESDLDNQSKRSGNPNHKIPDSMISKTEKRISRTSTGTDSKIATSGNLDSQKIPPKGNWQKYEKKRTAKGVFLRTNDEITKKFKQFCIANDWDFSQGTELAWNKLMNDLDIQPEADLDSLIAQDDRRLKMMFKTRLFIINLYLRYNSIFNEMSGSGGKKWNARWTPRDDEVARRYNELPPAIIELGILQTQIQKGFHTSRIQTFKYYTDEIEKVLASGVSDTMLETILNYHRQIWKNQTGREIDLGFLTEKG